MDSICELVKLLQLDDDCYDSDHIMDMAINKIKQLQCELERLQAIIADLPASWRLVFAKEGAE